MSDVTQKLAALEMGEGRAAEAPLPPVHDQLRRPAGWHLVNEPPGQTLPATALVPAAKTRGTPDPLKTNWFEGLARLGIVAGLLVITSGGCSIKRLAVNKLGNALAGSGTTFASDEDPELVKAAVPFSLKLMESLLAESPKHRGLLLAASSGFTQYSFAFVQQDADELESKDFAAAEAMRARAKRLYLRARDYGLRGLEIAHRGFTHQLAAQPRAAVARLTGRDVPQAYWTAAAWGAAISLSKDDPARVAEIPQMEALIDRALELDESWDDGAIHGFLINYEMSRQGVAGDAAARARQHFERALELTQGRQAGPLVTFAEAVCVEKQDAKQFEELLNRALALQPDAQPATRLVNLVMQRRAKWLLSRKEDLFLTVEKK